jgi:hypothetical protein
MCAATVRDFQLVAAWEPIAAVRRIADAILGLEKMLTAAESLTLELGLRIENS